MIRKTQLSEKKTTLPMEGTDSILDAIFKGRVRRSSNDALCFASTKSGEKEEE
jgi:hypothetical protein